VTIAPSSPGGTGRPELSTMRTSQPGIGFVGEPGLIGRSSSPAGFAQIAHPVSVCHQWSMTGIPSRSEAQW
jgi:hypothetical protein